MLRYAVVMALSGMMAAAGPALLASPQPDQVSSVRQVAYMDGYMQGSIVELNSDTITVKPMSKGNDTKVKVPSTAMVRVNGSMATFDDLRVGHLVTLMTETQDGVLVATMVEARSQM
jgi:hypothetical protein